jgi:hypothetical protein
MKLENQLARELDLEPRYLYIATAATLEALLPPGVKWQSFPAKYKKMGPTPTLFCEAGEHLSSWTAQFEGDLATGAEIWAIRKIWDAKRLAGHIIRADVAAAVDAAGRAREQQHLLYEAINRSAKNHPKFFAKFQTNLTELLRDVAMADLADTLGGRRHG